MRTDFPAYAEARWPALVDFLVAEGVEREQAEEQATAGLARCLPRWPQVSDDHDVDEQVLQEVTGRRDPAEVERFLASLHAERAADELPRREPPVAEIAARARSARRRTARRWGVAALAVALVVAGGWWLTAGGDTDRGRREANPLPMPWYYGDQLHLAERVLTMPRVTSLVAITGGGAAYVDEDGRVGLVDADGRATRIGTTRPDGRLAVDQDGDRITWATAGDNPVELVVYDVVDREVTNRRSLTDGPAQPLALDGGQVYFADRSGAYVWSIADSGDGSTRQVVRTLLDSAAGASLNQLSGEELQVIRSFTPVLTLPGLGGQLSHDGRRLLTYAPGDDGRPLAYDAIYGRRLDLGLPRSQDVVTGAFGPGGTFVFAVRHRANEHQADDSLRLSTSGPILLVVCRPGMGTGCETLTQVADDAAYPPVLAG